MLKNCRTAGLLWCALVFCGCAVGAAGSDVAVAGAPKGQRMSPDCVYAAIADDFTEYHIRNGDKLHISFYLNPEFDSDAVVRPDGKIEMPTVGEITAAGLTPLALQAQLDQLYLKELRNPGAMVRVEDSPGRVVFVEGEVARPGSVPLAPGMTALQAIAASGGLTDTAGPNNVVLVRRDTCGDPHDEKLNLSKAIKHQDNRDDVVLAPTDILIVPRSGIAEADLFVKQYIRDLLPIQPYLSPSF
jgi:protein involved in polysaccharide export with SLBB domain